MKTPATSSLVDNAHGIVKRRLLRGEVPLGHRISPRKLAAEFGMSFLPVSMALLRLEYEGFLERKPRAGTRVRIPSPEEIRGHYVVREALEVQAARLFVEAASPKEIEELKQHALAVDAVSTRPFRLSHVRLHQRFHQRIADGAGCRALAVTIEQILELECTWLCAIQQEDHTRPMHLHEELAETLAHRDPERAADAIRAHIAAGLDWLMVGLKPCFARRRKNSDTFGRRQPTQ